MERGLRLMELKSRATSLARSLDSSEGPDGQGETIVEAVGLSRAQANLVRRNWAAVRKGSSAAREPGLALLQQTFFLCPDLRLVFRLTDPPDRERDRAKPPSQERLKAHGATLTQFCERVFGELGREGCPSPEELRALGRRHAYFRSVAFKAMHWEAFGRALIDSAKTYGSGRGNAEAQLAWTKVACFVVDQLRSGYTDEAKKIRRKDRLRLVKTDSLDLPASPKRKDGMSRTPQGSPRESPRRGEEEPSEEKADRVTGLLTPHRLALRRRSKSLDLLSPHKADKPTAGEV